MKSSEGRQWLWVTMLSFSMVALGYWVDRSQTFSLFLFFGLSAFSFLRLINIKVEVNWFWLGMIPRMLLFFSLPALSEDYFRFLWDGMVSLEGLSPFGLTPSELVASGKFTLSTYGQTLYDGMNSNVYHAIYPPVVQWLFIVAASVKNLFGGVLILRTFILLAEIGVYYMLRKLLLRYRLSTNKIAWYWLNPLILIEGVGNLHFEPIMVFFLLLALYHFSRLKEVDGSFAFTFSLLTKWFTLIFLPLILLKVSTKRAVKILLVILAVAVCFYLPYASIDEGRNQLTSMFLFVRRFEFNASLYYLINNIGERMVGYNLNRVVGPLLVAVAFVLIGVITWVYRFRNRLKLFEGLLLIISCYLFLAPVVHPWYLFIPVALSVYSSFTFPLWWSMMVFLSYHAYAGQVVEENAWVIGLQYGVVFTILLAELKKRKVWLKLKAAF